MINDLTICVCGAGTMGSGIAQVFAQKGFQVILFDTNENGLTNAKTRIEKFAPGITTNIKFTSSIADCVAQLIIEAIIENANIKLQLFNDLARINSSKTIITTNTSSLSVNTLSNNISHPERFAGMHFFNPAPLMKLVEIVKTPLTSSAVLDTLTAIVRELQKTPVVCKDSPGFIVNRVARPYYLEALRLVEKNVAGIHTIDQLM
ncbi:MAG: 3-hydroxybutyryl-CoA dehydrogenase, partial [Chitinophagaceae bacterium]